MSRSEVIVFIASARAITGKRAMARSALRLQRISGMGAALEALQHVLGRTPATFGEVAFACTECLVKGRIVFDSGDLVGEEQADEGSVGARHCSRMIVLLPTQQISDHRLQQEEISLSAFVRSLHGVSPPDQYRSRPA